MTSIIRRCLGALLVIAGVGSLTFLLLHIIPGDPVEAMLGENIAVADRAAIRARLGLDLPLWQQYLNFWSGVLTFDFGESIHYQQPVAQLIMTKIGWTALLAVCAFLCATLIALPLGILAALNRNTWIDRSAMAFATLGISIPNFWMGLLLILGLAYWLNLFPIGGNDGLSSIVLPAITLGTAMSAVLSRMLRSSLLETLHDDYIRTAYAKGLSPHKVILHHALRNAALPMITLLGLQFGALLSGAVITEVVFSWPGIGQLMVDAIQRRDYPVVQVCVLLVATIYVVINAATDVIYGIVDPRINRSKQ